MESVIVKEHFITVQGCLDWANNMIGNKIPLHKGYIADRIEQFQIIMHNGESYTIIVLFRVVER